MVFGVQSPGLSKQSSWGTEKTRSVSFRLLLCKTSPSTGPLSVRVRFILHGSVQGRVFSEVFPGVTARPSTSLLPLRPVSVDHTALLDLFCMFHSWDASSVFHVAGLSAMPGTGVRLNSSTCSGCLAYQSGHLRPTLEGLGLVPSSSSCHCRSWEAEMRVQVIESLPLGKLGWSAWLLASPGPGLAAEGV